MLALDIAYMIYLKFEEYTNALQIALFLHNLEVSPPFITLELLLFSNFYVTSIFLLLNH